MTAKPMKPGEHKLRMLFHGRADAIEIAMGGLQTCGSRADRDRLMMSIGKGLALLLRERAVNMPYEAPAIASVDTRRMAETGNTDSVRSTGGAVGEAETPKG